MFMTNTFAGSAEASIPTLATAETIETITVRNAIILELLVTNEILTNLDGTIPQDWDFNTRLHALFDGNLYAGNVNYTADRVEYVRIKKKTELDSTWQTILEVPIETFEDFLIEFIDYYEPFGTIQYAYVPVISGAEGTYITNTVESKFDNWFIIERDTSYPIAYNLSTEETTNYGATAVKPIGRKYPVTVINGVTGYKTGSIKAVFLDMTCDDEFNSSTHDYRGRIYAMLTDGLPKLLKNYDRDLYMINIEGNITDSSRQDVTHDGTKMILVTSGFSWNECGDAYSAQDLYNNGFIDVETL